MSPFFPVHNFVALVHPTAGNIVYKRVFGGMLPQASTLAFRRPLTASQRALLDPDDVWMCPVVEADLAAEVSTNNVGQSREGDTIAMTWRWLGEYEEALGYRETFSYVGSAQSPVNTTRLSPQVDFNDEFSKVERYKPDAVPVASGVRSRVSYFLDTSENRDDYFFRGSMIRLQGGVTAEPLLYDTVLHRLAGDLVTISYDQQIAIANMNVKEVAL